jgi:hypothetical protein
LVARKLDDFVTSFETYARIFNTPPRYAKWAGLFAISLAAGRRIALRARGSLLAPNLYVQMIGPPATGKSRAIAACQSIVSKATDYVAMPSSLTRAGMEDYMRANIKSRKAPDGREQPSSECIGMSEELQGILPDQDLTHLTMYNILYDSPDGYSAVTRTHGEIKLDHPYCAILSGAQPSFLATTMPEQAWGMGFMSRTVMVWDIPNERQSMFEGASLDLDLQAKLVHDLRTIFNAFGWMQWEKPAIELYEQWWVKHGGNPIPAHKRLQMGYNGRRELQMVKLAMIFSLSQSTELIVTQEHVGRAISTLLEAEQQMQHIFNEMSSAGSIIALEDVMDKIRQNARDNRHTSEAELIEMLMQRFPATQIHSLVDGLLSSNVIEMVGEMQVKGFRKFGPGKRMAGV